MQVNTRCDQTMKSTAINVALYEYQKGIDDLKNNFTDSQKKELQSMLESATKLANNPTKIKKFSKELVKLDEKFVKFGGDLDKVADGVDDVKDELDKHVPIKRTIEHLKHAQNIPKSIKKVVFGGDD